MAKKYKYKCATPECPTTSKFKGNIVRHLKGCAKQKRERNKKLTIKYDLIVERFSYGCIPRINITMILGTILPQKN